MNWFRRKYWTDRASMLFRYHAQKIGYRVRFVESDGTAYVDLVRRDCVINPHFPSVPLGARHRQSDPLLERDLWLEGFIAHEAAHVRFSCHKPLGRLGEIWNMLEDERIERKQSAGRPQLAQAFTRMGDTYLLTRGDNDDRSALAGCLYWRWAHDHPLGWSSVEPELWDEVRPLVEASWVATSSEDVIQYAHSILELIDRAHPESIESDLANSALVSATGGAGRGDALGISGEGAQTTGLEPTDEEQADQSPRVQADEQNGDEEEQSPDAKTSALGGRGVNYDHPGDLTGAEIIVERVEIAADQLARALRPPEAPHFQRAHRSRGRFDYAREVAQRDRVFVQRVRPGRPEELAIAVLLDISASMFGERIDTALNATVLLSRACELAKTPMALATFGQQTRVVGDFGTAPDELRGSLESIELEDGTILHPAFKWGLELPSQHRKLLIVISDGSLDDHDCQRCQTLQLEHRAVTVLPILIGADDSTAEQYRRTFNRVLEVDHLEELPKLIISWIRTQMSTKS
jgi:Mg-chelatase subunit ChlD